MQGKHALDIEAASDGTAKDSNKLSSWFAGSNVYAVITAVGLVILVVSVVLAIVLSPKKTVRTYYISTEDVHWDYTLSLMMRALGKRLRIPPTSLLAEDTGIRQDSTTV